MLLEALGDQAMMANQGLPEVKEKVVALVHPGHPVPEVSLVSWVSLVLKEMMVLLGRTENEVALEGLDFRALLERMVKLDLRVPQALLGPLVTRETRDHLVPKDYRACLVLLDPQEKTENPVMQVPRVMLVRLELPEARVTLVPLANVGLLDWQGPQVFEEELVPPVLKVERAPLVPLGHLVLLVVLVCKACLEKEEALEVLVQKVKRVNQAVQVQTVPPGKTAPGVLLVLLVLLAQLVSLEIRVKVVLLDFQA